ncbi:ABC transporter substrate-binding protein [bacterium]|nr:MAG: ABC transporter substrate-binding protein [bacterium]
MYRKSSGSMVIVRVFLLAFVIVAFSPGAFRAASAPDQSTVEMGLPNDGVYGLGGQYILDKGIDRKHGFITTPRWGGVADIERLLAIGGVPVSLTTSESALRANLSGIPIRLIQPFMTSHHHVLVRTESRYKSIHELRGKPLALTPEVTSLYNMFDFLMRKQGINIEKDFLLKKLGAAGIIAVLEKGEVEGAILWEAHVSRLLATGRYRVIMALREELGKALNAEVKLLGWVGALEPWVRQNPGMVSKLRAAWEEAKGVQEDEGHFRKHAKEMFGLEKPDEVSLGWRRTRTFILPLDFRWPDVPALGAEKAYLNEGVKLGVFPKEATASVIDAMFVP